MHSKRGIPWYQDWDPDKDYDTPTVIMTAGWIGSGKTYWAKQYVKDHPNFVRINKDDIRKEMRVSQGKSEEAKVLEKEVITREEELTLQALKKGLSVILDSTHTNPVHVKERVPQLLSRNGFSSVPVLVNASFLDVPIETCILQDSLREGTEKLGEAVIRGMWRQWGSYWEPRYYWNYLERLVEYENTSPETIQKQKAICFDLDGTLSNLGDRGRWEENKVEVDLPNIPVVNLCKMYLKNPSYQVIFLSGRKDSCRRETENWLHSYLGVTSPKLFMRKHDDNRGDDLVKKEIYYRDIEPYYFVEACVEDRVRVIKVWESLGLFVFNVNQGNKEF